MDSFVMEHMVVSFFTTRAQMSVAGDIGIGAFMSANMSTSGKAASPESLLPDDGELRGDETLLVVDDEPSILQVVEKLLTPLGYTVLTADSSQAAETLLQHDRAVDLLITDVVMPSMSGPALFQKLSELQPSLRTIYMSGYVDETLLAVWPTGSAPSILRKPFTLLELAGAVREALAPI
jgi:two-component system, cell cycle sensor histidine kinase and response regulator CckA